MLILLKDYVKDRSQLTVISNVVSQHEITNVRILQGFCLSPLLFLVYISYIFSSTKINIRLFADDACLSYKHSDPEYLNEVISKELLKADKWLPANTFFY